MTDKVTTRDRILDTSAGLFRRQGAAATGLKEIVRESGAPWGSVYHYFPDGKDQLIAESLRRTGERYAGLMERAFVGVDTPAAGVRRYFDAAADNLISSDFADGCPVGTVTLEIANSNDELRGVCAEIFDDWQRAVADSLISAGLGKQPAADLARQFLLALEGGLMLARAHRDDTILRRAGEVVAAAVDAATPRPRRRGR